MLNLASTKFLNFLQNYSKKYLNLMLENSN